MIEGLHFCTRVLGPAAAFKLEQRQVTQTLRSKNDIITHAILLGRISAGNRLQILLDSIIVGTVAFVSIDSTTWEALGSRDARRGGFDNLDDLSEALKRAGYRYKALNEYEFYRIQFSWLEEVYA